MTYPDVDTALTFAESFPNSPLASFMAVASLTVLANEVRRQREELAALRDIIKGLHVMLGEHAISVEFDQDYWQRHFL